MTLTPDHDFAIHNFDEDDIVVLERGADFPDEVRSSCYAFDPIAAHVLAGFRRRAKLHAAILGEATELQEPSATEWIYADPLDARMGETVSADALAVDGAFESMGDRGVLRIDGEVKFVERVLLADIPTSCTAGAHRRATRERSACTPTPPAARTSTSATPCP